MGQKFYSNNPTAILLSVPLHVFLEVGSWSKNFEILELWQYFNKIISLFCNILLANGFSYEKAIHKWWNMNYLANKCFSIFKCRHSFKNQAKQKSMSQILLFKIYSTLNWKVWTKLFRFFYDQIYRLFQKMYTYSLNNYKGSAY